MILAGFVPDAELVHLYRRAYALVQPSLMEGFGLPAVEAWPAARRWFAAGPDRFPRSWATPASSSTRPTSRRSPRPCRRIIAYPRMRDGLASRALNRASLFTWDRAATTLLESFNELSSSRRGRSYQPWHGARGTDSHAGMSLCLEETESTG